MASDEKTDYERNKKTFFSSKAWQHFSPPARKDWRTEEINLHSINSPRLQHPDPQQKNLLSVLIQQLIYFLIIPDKEEGYGEHLVFYASQNQTCGRIRAISRILGRSCLVECYINTDREALHFSEENNSPHKSLELDLPCYISWALRKNLSDNYSTIFYAQMHSYFGTHFHEPSRKSLRICSFSETFFYIFL